MQRVARPGAGNRGTHPTGDQPPDDDRERERASDTECRGGDERCAGNDEFMWSSVAIAMAAVKARRAVIARDRRASARRS